MKYPLDPITYNEFITHIISHSNMQTVIIQKLFEILDQAIDIEEPDEDTEWAKDAIALKNDLDALKSGHETRRWNEANYNAQMNSGAYKAPMQPIVVPETKAIARIVDEGLQPGKIEVIPRDDGHIVGLPGLQFDARLNAKANVEEAKFGPEMSEEELERHFSQNNVRTVNRKKEKPKPKTLDTMTMEEIEQWEAEQNNSTDIYKVAARVKNLARGGNASLTQQGDMLCNSYTHVMLAFYDFASKLEDKNVKAQLTKLIRNQEGMPGDIIAAAGAGVKTKK